jgi:histidine triad (HIT) family protein
VDCLFCGIVSGDVPSKKLYEDDKVLAFYDINPQAPVHFLIIPKEHIASAACIDESNSEIVGHMFEVAAKLTKDLGIESYRLISNIGDQAQQSVHHLHLHVLAGRDFTWPPG